MRTCRRSWWLDHRRRIQFPGSYVRLGVDNVEQFRVLLPNGIYVTARRCINEDIFFALAGGGGGSFGVIMDMNTRVHPRVIIQVMSPNAAFTTSDGILKDYSFHFPDLSSEHAKELFSILTANANDWAAERWGGFVVLHRASAQ